MGRGREVRFRRLVMGVVMVEESLVCKVKLTMAVWS